MSRWALRMIAVWVLQSSTDNLHEGSMWTSGLALRQSGVCRAEVTPCKRTAHQ